MTVLTKDRPAARLAGKNLIHPSGQIAKPGGRISAALFGDAPTLIADIVEGFHDGGPVVAAFEKLHIKARIGTGFIAFF